MNIQHPILRHGEPLMLNKKVIIGNRKDVKDSILTANDRVRGLSGLKFLAGNKYSEIIIREAVKYTDTLEIDGIKQKILKTETRRRRGKLVYTKLIAYDDFFTSAINIYDQEIGNNLPRVSDTPKHEELNCTIVTATEKELVQLSLLTDGKATHVFLAEMELETYNIDISDRVIWNNRSFEILAIENINEKLGFLLITTREILGATALVDAPKVDFLTEKGE